MIRFCTIIFCFYVILSFNGFCTNETKDRAVFFTVIVDSSAAINNSGPVKFNISWDNSDDSSGTFYVLKKKLYNDVTWKIINTFPRATNTYIDTTILPNSPVEYGIEKVSIPPTYSGYGYIAAGYEMQMTEDRGRALLIVDETVSDSLKYELSRFESDLNGDGYSVIKYNLPRTEIFNPYEVQKIKDVVDREYNKNPKIPLVLILFGRIAVPYSGNTAYDGHPQHEGAWATDLYYTVEQSIWTDVDVISTGGEREETINLPHDGKFDQSVITKSRIPNGRIDFYNLPAFKQSEIELLRNYLNKNHDFRMKNITPVYRGLIDDWLQMYGDIGFSATAWMNFCSMLGTKNIDVGNFVDYNHNQPSLTNFNYIWSFACNSGSYNSVAQAIYTEQFASIKINGIFTLLFGSYLGDWDSPDNIIRAALASSPSILTCIWDGMPFWFFHRMALGEPIGISCLNSINNDGNIYKSTNKYGLQGIQMNLMGDPTLRMIYPAPPIDLHIVADTFIANNRRVNLSWSKPNDSIIGYYIYRSDDRNSKYLKLNDIPQPELTYNDTNALIGKSVYMVRSVKHEYTPTGSYYNLSQGVFIDVDLYVSVKDPTQNTKELICTPNPVSDKLNIYFDLNQPAKINLSVYSAAGIKITEIADGYYNSGVNSLLWNIDKETKKIISGIYLLKFQENNNIKVAKISIIH